MKIKEAIEEAKEKAKDRNFKQSVDLCINLKNIDLTKPENRFSSEILLPHGKGKDLKICVVADNTLKDAKEVTREVISKEKLEKLKNNKSQAKKIAERNDYFLAEASMMPKIGKILGPILGPRGKMPKPFTPDSNLKDLVNKTKKMFSVKLRENRTIQTSVGKEDMNTDKIVDNIEAILDLFEKNLPKGKNQIGSVYVKLTMGPSVKIGG